MRVFLDTNVLAAAFGTRGLCADVLRETLLRHRLVSSKEVETELERALRVKFRAPADAVREALGLLRRSSVRVSARPSRPVPLPDPADRAIVSAAVNGRAEVLVTGDREMQAMGGFGGTEILSPRAFWEKVRRSGEEE